MAIEIERIIVADSVDRRANELRKSLADIGCRAVTILRSQDGLVPSVQTEQPDVVLVAAQAPAGSVRGVEQLMREQPCPIVLYAGPRDPESITAAVDAGVSAYVTEDLRKRDLQQVLELAIARFRKYQSMAAELGAARDKLEERTLMDKAKALLIKHHGLDEAAAHQMLQQLAMNQRVPIRAAADNVVAMLQTLERR